MKAVAVFPHTHEVKLIDHEEPRILQPTHVKLRMLEVGVCGTDKGIISFGFGTPPEGYDYLILGHESLGEVIEVGPLVQQIKRGDLIVTTVRRPCNHPDCPACRSGHQDFCSTGDFSERGIKKAHGFLTEFVVDEERYMHIVPKELRDVGILVEPLTIAEKALLQVWELQRRLPWIEPDAPINERGKGLKAVVLGAGPIGILGAMTLIAQGFETYVYSRSKAPNPKALLVESIGATYISNEETTVDQLAAQLGNIDLVYEALGASQVAFEVMKVLSANAVFIFTGVPGHNTPIQLDSSLLMSNLVPKNQIVVGTVNAGKDAFEAAIHDLGTFTQHWPQAVRALITARYPLEDFHAPLFGEAGGIKNVISFSI